MAKQPAPDTRRVPDVAEVERIAAGENPVVRNLQITQCYHELSAALVERTGAAANWCTFATWASKQAGQTIRKEDLARTLEAAVSTIPVLEQAVVAIIGAARLLGAKQDHEDLRRAIWRILIGAPVDHAADAVGRGNKKVFEEIGLEFARFGATCLSDPAFEAGSIEHFCDGLRPGDPPEGQQYLRQAFTRYYRSFFEADRKRRAELQLFANIEIGFHEQTRLQPEIAESLDAAVMEPSELRRRVIAALFPARGWLTRLRLWLLSLFGRRSPFDEVTEPFIVHARQQLRLAITAHVMTMTFPPDVRLQLGRDLAARYPALLEQLGDLELVALLARIDPTPDSVRGTGTADWADLPDRMHFIADLFRCYHATAELLEAPFDPRQTEAIKAGSVPDGRL